MSRELKKWLWLLALVVLLAVPLVFLLSRLSGDFVRDVVALPLTYISWLGRVYVETVPRALFWGALLLFGLILAITNVLVAMGRPDGGKDGLDPAIELDQLHPGRVQQLTSQIRFASRSAYFRRRLAQDLGLLLLRSLDYAEQYSPAEVERGLDGLKAPEEIRAFLREGNHLITPTRPVGLRDWLRRRLRGRERRPVSMRDLERVVEFLEDRLEVR